MHDSRKTGVVHVVKVIFCHSSVVKEVKKRVRVGWKNISRVICGERLAAKVKGKVYEREVTSYVEWF